MLRDLYNLPKLRIYDNKSKLFIIIYGSGTFYINKQTLRFNPFSKLFNVS